MKRDVPFVLEEAAWPAFLVEPNGTIRRPNSAALHILGFSSGPPAAQLTAIWDPENEKPADEFLAKLEKSSSGAVSLKFCLQQGTSARFLTYISKVTREGHAYYVFQLFHEDGTHSASLPALVEQAAPAPATQVRLVFALDNAAWPALTVDADGTIQHANETAVAVFGSNLRSGSARLAFFWDTGNPASVEKFLERLSPLQPAPATAAFRLKDGTTENFSVRACALEDESRKLLCLQLLKPQQEAGPAPGATPVLEAAVAANAEGGQSSLDAGVAHKQKLDCALQLARTVALDFNNALTSILGHASLLLGKAEAKHPWRSSLVEIEKSASKAAEIAHDLASFSRQEREAAAQNSGNLNMVLQRAVDVFRTPELSHLTWSMQLERKSFAVTFDEAKLQQAFIKVLENSVQAAGREGRISVQTRNLEFQEPSQDRTAKLNPGSYVCVEIADNGSGIAPDVLPRIFEPFFTTKKDNHRGLGLAWVYGIVTNHGGTVAVSSQPGLGASVRIYLPAQNKIVKDAAASTDDLSGNQTVLIVDDEDLLLTMGQMILSSFGYQVLTANSGQQALEIISSGKTVDLVITDLVMPNMSGRELIEHIRKMAPGTKVISSSGFVRSKGNGEELYLQKPFTSQDLLRKVKQALADTD